MIMDKYTDEQIAEACAKCIDKWDMDTLMEYAQEKMFIQMTEKAYAEDLQRLMEDHG